MFCKGKLIAPCCGHSDVWLLSDPPIVGRITDQVLQLPTYLVLTHHPAYSPTYLHSVVHIYLHCRLQTYLLIHLPTSSYYQVLHLPTYSVMAGQANLNMLGHLNFAWNKNTYTTTMRLLIIAQVCLLIIFYILSRGEGVEPEVDKQN